MKFDKPEMKDTIVHEEKKQNIHGSNRFFKYFLGVIILWTCLVLTNPTLEDYKSYVRNKMIGNEKNIFTQIGSYVISETAGNFVVKYDYKIFSVFVVPNPYGGDYKTIGILKILIDL